MTMVREMFNIKSDIRSKQRKFLYVLDKLGISAYVVVFVMLL